MKRPYIWGPTTSGRLNLKMRIFLIVLVVIPFTVASSAGPGCYDDPTPAPIPTEYQAADLGPRPTSTPLSPQERMWGDAQELYTTRAVENERALNRRDAVRRARDIFTQRHGDGPLEEWSQALWGGVITQQDTDTVMEGIYYFPAHGSGYRSDPDHLIWLLVFEEPVVVAEGRTYTRYQAIAFFADNGSFRDYLKTNQPASHRSDKRLIPWIPACAGMTIRGRGLLS